MKRTILLLIAFISISITTKAQQGLYSYDDFTPYEKQRSDLAGQAGKKVYDALSEQDKIAYSMTVLSIANNAKNDYEIMLGIEETLCTIFGVATLINPEKSESFYEYRLTNQMKTIAQWYFEERAKIEEQKTALDEVRENERNSSLNAIKRGIKDAFVEWSTKGTYEKRDDYERRLQHKAAIAYDSICQIVLAKHYFDDIYLNSLGYDVDKELFSIKTYYRVNNEETSSITLTTSMTVEGAKEYMNENNLSNFTNYRWCPLNFYQYEGFLQSTKLLDIEYVNCYEASLGLDKKITIPYNELGIENSDLNSVMSNHVFDYNGYMEEKLQYLDSLHSWSSNIGKKLDNLNNLLGKGPWGDKDGLHDVWHTWKRVYYDPAMYINKPSDLEYWIKEVQNFENKTKSFISKELSIYSLAFDSYDDFLNFFYSENAIDISLLTRLIKEKFDKFTATISNVKELKSAKDTPAGKMMLNYCAMSNQEGAVRYKYLHRDCIVMRPVGEFVENMLMEYVLQNKVLKKKLNSSYPHPYELAETKYASFIIARYISEGN